MKHQHENSWGFPNFLEGRKFPKNVPEYNPSGLQICLKFDAVFIDGKLRMKIAVVDNPTVIWHPRRVLTFNWLGMSHYTVKKITPPVF